MVADKDARPRDVQIVMRVDYAKLYAYKRGKDGSKYFSDIIVDLATVGLDEGDENGQHGANN